MENCIITLTFIYFLVFFTKNKPPTPPSVVAMRNHTSITQGMKQDFLILMRNRNFVWTLVCYSLLFTIYSSFGIVVSYLFYNFHAFAVSLLSMLFVTIGALSCFVVGIYLDRTSKYLTTLRTILISTCVLLVFSAATVPEGSLWSALVFAVLGGLIMVPIVPTGFSFATELTHPVSPALVIGLMCCVASVSCFIMTEIFLVILTGNNQEKDCRLVLAIMAILGFGSSMFSFFIREDLRRLDSLSSFSMVSSNTTLKIHSEAKE